MKIDRLDHLVLTVADLTITCEFYNNILGMETEQFGNGRLALKYGNQKINLHQKGKEFEPKAQYPWPGSADLCFIAETKMDKVVEELKAGNIKIIEGPVERTGALGKMLSVYFRDPDGNLIEISNYL
ncbi:VOC family protein [Dyadobacter subterraneus]|uniref:VOC family protein n=1 Tax=Dyadobacter subterraneus TaxID=2773304 RepID=A0ABR9WFM4_9BACT|nr:VOC family protein [Dyadobacter subterraneus]MBE9464309.1 VOC family protein [Dyadobacter subterraneus]